MSGSCFKQLAILAIVFVAVAQFQGFAQLSSASVTGVVRDVSGSVIPNVKITLQNVATSVAHNTVTNTAGNYLFLGITPGEYTLQAEASGFEVSKIPQVTLAVNQTATLDLTMQVGTIQQSVTVEASGQLVQSATAELGAVVSEKQVFDLPLNGRNFTQLLSLTPGVAPVSVPQNAGGFGNVFTGGNFVFRAINGQTNRSNFFLMDGINDQGSFQSTYSVAPIVDQIEEFKVNSHNDQAEFGGVLGGVINVVTKSGTNQLHGTAWEFLRNNDFDARNTFFSSVTPYRQNQFGVAAGGPVWFPKIYNGRNKTFFFGAYEGQRFTQASNNYLHLPTAAELSGNLGGQAQAFSASAHRAPVLPGGGVGRRARCHFGRRPGLAAVPGRDVPARLGQGLLDQRGLPGGAARPAGNARPALRRGVRPVHKHVPGGRAGDGHRRRGGARQRDRPLDGAGRAARPCAVRQRARRPARQLGRDRLAVPAYPDGHSGRSAPVGGTAPHLGCGGDRGPPGRAGTQRADDAAPGTSPGAVLRGVPVFLPVPRCDGLPGRGALAALRGFAALPRGGQLADEADPPGEGEQGRRAQTRACTGHGCPYQGGGGGRAPRARRATRGGPHAGARHHEGAPAVRLRLAPAHRDRADQGVVRAAGRGGGGGVLGRPRAAAVQRAALRKNRERRARLPGQDAAGSPAAHQPRQDPILREQAMTVTERQFVGAVDVQHVREIVRRPSPFQFRIVRIQEGLEAALLIAQRIAQHLREHVVRLPLEPVAVPMPHVHLQRVIARVAVVGDQVAAQNVRIGEEVDGTVQTVSLVKCGQCSDGSLVDVRPDGTIRQHTAAP